MSSRTDGAAPRRDDVASPAARPPIDPLFAALALAALLVRVAALLAVGFNPAYFDVDGYHGCALAGLSGAPIPTDHHPPGTAFAIQLFYAVAGVRPRLFLAAQAVLGALACFLVADAAGRTMGRRAGLLAGALLAFNPYAVLATAALASENLALPAFALFVWLLARDLPSVPFARLVAAALVVSAMGLVRSALLAVALPLALVPVLGLARRPETLRRRLAAGALLLAISFSGPLAYGLHRARRTGVLRLGSPNDVYNLWVGNNPHATGRIQAMPGLPPPDLGREEVARILAPRVKEFLLRHPGRQVPLLLRRLSHNLAPPKRDLIYIYGHGWAGERSPGVVLTAYAAAALSFPFLGALVLLAFARSGRCLPFLAGIAIASAALVPYLLAIGDARYLLPAYPALCLAAGALAAAKVPSPWSRSRRLAAALLAVLFFGNAARDVALTDPALRAVSAPGGSSLDPPYDLAW